MHFKLNTKTTAEMNLLKNTKFRFEKSIAKKKILLFLSWIYSAKYPKYPAKSNHSVFGQPNIRQKVRIQNSGRVFAASLINAWEF